MTDWQRLDRRMLLVHPITELRRFIVPLLGVLVLGISQAGPYAAVAAVAIPVVIGVVRYLTTSYRIADGRIELQRGLLQRQRLSAPLDRVRTVDVTASVVHRVLGLATTTVGTGTDAGDKIELDALSREQASLLRDRLLAEATVAATPATGETPDAPLPTGPAGPPPPPPPPVVSFSPRWLWYAPFTSTGLVVVGALFAGAAQLFGESGIRVDIDDSDLAAVSGLLVTAAVLVLAVVALVATVLGYLVTNGGLTLTRTGGNWQLSRGLLTRRETSIDVDRLAGVVVGEQAGLRLARGGRLSAIVTGLDRSDTGSAVLVPPAPAATVRAAAAAVLGTTEPVDAPLTAHGPTATRRRYVRALVPAGALAVAATAAIVLAGLPLWLLVVPVLTVGAGAALAVDRARSLGHALVAGHLVGRSGSLLRRREMLDREHIIGWALRDSWFQRRAGLVDLVATTAGGRGAVTLLDVPASDAVALADAGVPDLVAQFTTTPPTG